MVHESLADPGPQQFKKCDWSSSVDITSGGIYSELQLVVSTTANAVTRLDKAEVDSQPRVET